MQLKTALPIIAIAILYTLSLLIELLVSGTEPGLFLAFREIIKAILCVGIAYLFLHKSSPINLQVKRAKLEALLGFAAFALTLTVLCLYWAAPQLLFPHEWVRPIYNVVGFDPAVIWVVLAMAGIPVCIWVFGRYSLKDVGLSIPKKRHILTWLVTFAVAVTLAFLLALSYGSNFLAPYFQDLLNLDTAKWLFLAFLPEELLFRVYLQTRLEKLMNPSWAILITAVLFNLLHAPQQILGMGWSTPSIIANVLLPVNGLIGGYIWYKTRNLPILTLYHMTIYQL
jgi:membrane protease YdiL (CAAX protease family)